MILSTHAIAGGAVASLFPSHPVTAFVAGFLSHYILDSIPHWDYKVLSAYANSKSARVDKNFVFDLMRIGSDALIGLIGILIIWKFVLNVDLSILILGAVGGMLPDFLQFIYARFPHQPMIAVQKLHSFMHTGYKISSKPVFGITLQIITLTVVVGLVKYLSGF